MSADPALVQRITDLLAGLGDTPDAVAARLGEMGIRGVVKEPELCPIAMVVRTVDGADEVGYLNVCNSAMTLDDTAWEVPEPIELPPAVKAFVRAFDGGLYPDLIEAAP